ncbi:MAG: hypothetical protein R3308_03980, partial [Thiohalobacterales bacterium]|nr:hypothetical protein [Thiohalobacterales bacterium]
MKTADRHIELLLPGLQGPSSDRPVGDYLERRPPALDRLLSRAQPGHLAGHGLDATLLTLFGLDPATPVAPLCYAADTGQPPEGYVMRADPVHLRADQSSLRLFESHSFPVTRQEADALVAAFNAFYEERGWALVAPHPQRWYLLTDRAPAVEMTPPTDVAGEDIQAALPRGADAAGWHALLNEVQMLFHAQEVNRLREQQGQPLINSIWPWGGGMMPAAGRPPARRILTDNPLARALAGT